MLVTCLDLEGVLFPEVWINVAEKTGIKDLRLTTRDIADYDQLMQYRLGIIEKNNLTLTDIQETIATMQPFPGAVEFLDWLRNQGQVIILSDTFEEFAKPIMKMLKMPTIFCHSLGVNDQDIITSYHLRLDDAKKKAVQALRQLNFKIIAAGDSFNDISMLKEADFGAFYCPPPEIAAKFPELPVTNNYEELKKTFSDYLAG
ncbi:MAG: bifunctional phosphoserine phosphatase/homoserine phosphotransferase ThrH [Proteobacteria bacterium]|nr:bifunctional phosphoserine phosphatase/homoserine phosphotransferase ThrH [Pseudomonadota bacterium]